MDEKRPEVPSNNGFNLGESDGRFLQLIVNLINYLSIETCDWTVQNGNGGSTSSTYLTYAKLDYALSKSK